MAKQNKHCSIDFEQEFEHSGFRPNSNSFAYIWDRNMIQTSGYVQLEQKLIQKDS